MSNPLPPVWRDQSEPPIPRHAGSTAILTSTTDSDSDRSDLGQHLRQCAQSRGRLHRLRCVAQAFDAFLMPRFVTTLGVVTLLMLVGMMWLS